LLKLALFSRKHFQAHKFAYEALMLFAYFTINAGINATSIIMEDSRNEHASFSFWEPIVWEYTSAYSTLFLVPIIAIFLKRFPWNWQRLMFCSAALITAGFVFSILHVSLMVGLRELIYLFANSGYDFSSSISNFLFEFFYELRKDLWSFVFFVLLICVYRYAISQWLGDAHAIKTATTQGASVQTTTQLGKLLLIRKLGKEFLIKSEDIEWAESCGNYVNLRVGREFYPMRTTMSDFITKCSELNIVRVHKSHAVNLQFVHAIEPRSSGDADIIMQLSSDNCSKVDTNNVQIEKRIRLSRRYKDNFESSLAKSTIQ